jgi:hypothetical protein
MMLAGGASTGVGIAHLGCFWRFEIRVYMLVLTRPHVGNAQKRRLSLHRDANGTGVKTLGDGQVRGKSTGNTDLLRVHLKLAHNLDGHLAVLAGGVAGAVHVAEGAVAHLLDQVPALEPGVAGHLALGLALLCDDAFEHRRVDCLALCGRLHLLLVGCCAFGSGTGLGSDVAVVSGSRADRVVAVGDVAVRGRLLGHDGLRHAMVDGVGGVVTLLLRLGVDVGDVGRGLGVLAGLLAMAQEVLKILYRSHV